MISIITEGKGRFKVTCDRCLCVFEYDWSDLEIFIACEYVTCPCCGCSIAHKPEVSVAPKGEVAREIFEEIEKIKKEYASGDIDENELYVRLHLLKKKYTEESKK